MIIGLDLGTTNVKAVLESEDGELLAEAGAPVSLYTADAGVVEQDMEEIRQAMLTVLSAVGARVGVDEVRAVGVSAQGGALQVVNGRNVPVGPVVGWMDNRGAPWDRSLSVEFGPDWFIRHTGHPRARGAVGQVLRLHEQEPGLLAPPNGLGFVGDVAVGVLCGVRAHDATSLSIAGLYNPERRSADVELLERLDLDPARLPALLPAVQPAGGLAPDVAGATGLRPGIPVMPAIHDQYAAAVGAGVLVPGDVMVGTGTAWVLLGVTDRLVPPAADAALVCTHVLEGLFGQMLAPGTGGAAFDWALRLIGAGDADAESLDARLAAVRAGCDGLRCVPLFSSLTPPGLNSTGHGAFLGVQLHHGPNHFLRAVVEGLACELARDLALLGTAGLRPSRLVLCGGAAAGRVTPQIVADATGLPVLRLERSATSAHGAAVLAQMARSAGVSLVAMSERMAGPATLIEPGADSATGRRLAAEYVSRLMPGR
ncbi:MAG: FGGY-family carbohydrate kinase [Kiritimatiellaeota bacterium]|nr:FGGY-family carbohydrate kinase [Kiritimatiellota bacterium]